MVLKRSDLYRATPAVTRGIGFVSHSKDLPNFEVFYDKQGVLRTYYNQNTYGIDLWEGRNLPWHRPPEVFLVSSEGHAV